MRIILATGGLDDVAMALGETIVVEVITGSVVLFALSLWKRSQGRRDCLHPSFDGRSILSALDGYSAAAVIRLCRSLLAIQVASHFGHLGAVGFGRGSLPCESDSTQKAQDRCTHYLHSIAVARAPHRGQSSPRDPDTVYRNSSRSRGLFYVAVPVWLSSISSLSCHHLQTTDTGCLPLKKNIGAKDGNDATRGKPPDCWLHYQRFLHQLRSALDAATHFVKP